ncbi:MAG: lysylphosphatidylglycerol synthase domain-containing protein [Leptolyngbya sp. BL-A-14]
MKSIGRLKPFLRWIVLGGTLFFLGSVLKQHWQKVVSIRLDSAGWACLTIALGITLLAHICAGGVWSWLLQVFRQPVNRIWLVQAYLQTTIAKYLPGNVWHYYGRITAATSAGATLETATVSVLLEPLLMAAAALLVTLLYSQPIVARYGLPALGLQWASLLVVLASVHPRVINPLVRLLRKLKQTTTKTASEALPFKLEHYPLVPLLGEVSFLLLRSLGFVLTFLALSPIQVNQLPLLLSAFSLAWLLGLVVPGAPGGLGVFEATAIALLGQTFSPGLILSVVALYRLISVLAEAVGAALAWLDQRRLA